MSFFTAYSYREPNITYICLQASSFLRIQYEAQYATRHAKFKNTYWTRDASGITMKDIPPPLPRSHTTPSEPPPKTTMSEYAAAPCAANVCRGHVRPPSLLTLIVKSRRSVVLAGLLNKSARPLLPE
jgi:hypothetical protein